MAKKRARKKRRGLSEGLSARVKRSRRGRRRSTRKKRGFLSELSSGDNMMSYVKEGFSGGLGGFLGGEIEPMVAQYSPFQQALVYLGASYLAYSSGYKNVSMGVAGAYGFKLSRQRRGLADDFEDHDYADQEALNDMCDAQDEQGNPMYLADDGNYYYEDELEEDDDGDDDDDDMADQFQLSDQYPLSQAPHLLADAPHLLADNMYPNYVNTSNY